MDPVIELARNIIIDVISDYDAIYGEEDQRAIATRIVTDLVTAGIITPRA